jgi:hypothetical protein
MSGNAVQKLVDAPEGKKPYPVHLQVHEDCWCCGRVVEAGSDLEGANVNLPMKQIVASAKRRTLKVEKRQVCIGQLLNTPGRVIEAEVESVGKLLEVAEEELVFRLTRSRRPTRSLHGASARQAVRAGEPKEISVQAVYAERRRTCRNDQLFWQSVSDSARGGRREPTAAHVCRESGFNERRVSACQRD